MSLRRTACHSYERVNGPSSLFITFKLITLLCSSLCSSVAGSGRHRSVYALIENADGVTASSPCLLTDAAKFCKRLSPCPFTVLCCACVVTTLSQFMAALHHGARQGFFSVQLCTDCAVVKNFVQLLTEICAVVKMQFFCAQKQIIFSNANNTMSPSMTVTVSHTVRHRYNVGFKHLFPTNVLLLCLHD